MGVEEGASPSRRLLLGFFGIWGIGGFLIIKEERLFLGGAGGPLTAGLAAGLAAGFGGGNLSYIRLGALAGLMAIGRMGAGFGDVGQRAIGILLLLHEALCIGGGAFVFWPLFLFLLFLVYMINNFCKFALFLIWAR